MKNYMSPEKKKEEKSSSETVLSHRTSIMLAGGTVNQHPLQTHDGRRQKPLGIQLLLLFGPEKCFLRTDNVSFTRVDT